MKPQNVNHSKFIVKKIVYNTNDFSIAYGTWEDGTDVLGMRWNGDKEEDLGFPSSRGTAVWFIIPEELTIPITKALLETEDKNIPEIISVLSTEFAVIA